MNNRKFLLVVALLLLIIGRAVHGLATTINKDTTITFQGKDYEIFTLVGEGYTKDGTRRPVYSLRVVPKQ